MAPAPQRVQRLLVQVGLSWLCGWIWLLPTLGQAAGLFLHPQGVRPLAMGGAYMVYVDDVHGMHNNPATLWQIPLKVQLDATYAPVHRTLFQRRLSSAEASGETVTFAQVEGNSLHLPIPSVLAGGRLPFWPQGALGIGIFGSSSMLQQWPNPRQFPLTPQRYTSGDVQGTWLLQAPLVLAFSVAPWLQVGAGIEALFGQFMAEHTLSACDGILCRQAENPLYDVYVQVVAPQVLAWSGRWGVVLQPWPFFGISIAYHLGYRLQLPAMFRATLPAAPMYREAQLVPDPLKGTLRMSLPGSLQVGMGGRWHDHVLQLAWQWQDWSVHKAIDVDVPQGEVRGIAGLPSYGVAGLQLPRHFQDTWSLHLGYQTPRMRLVAHHPLFVQFRAGWMMEPSAIAPAWLSSAAVDLDKSILSVGGGVHWGPWAGEWVVAGVGMLPRLITISQVEQPSLLRPPWSGRTKVAQGEYQSWALILGLGFSYTWAPAEDLL